MFRVQQLRPWWAIAIVLMVGVEAPAQVKDPSTGHIYQKLATPGGGTWQEARDTATALGGHLATITSQYEHNFVSQFAPDFPTSEVVFIGATDEGHEGVWRWVTGESWNYINWLSSQPDNSQGVQHYLIMYKQGWDDANASYPGSSFIVEWESNRILRVPSEHSTIQGAINYGLSGDTVLVAPGTYTQAISYGNKAIVVQSEQGPEVTFLDALTGVTMQFADGAVLDGFTFTACTGTLVGASASTCVVRNCRFVNTRTAGEGISGDEWATVKVQCCLFKNATLNMVMFCTGPNCEFINNTVDSGGRGLAIYGPNSIVKNNIVANLDLYGIWTVDATTVVDYNDFRGNHPDYGGGTLPGVHDLSVDPRFQNPSENDYHLRSDSPCIDAGDPGPIYNDPDGSRNDMGVFPSISRPQTSSLVIGAPQESLHITNDHPVVAWGYFDPQSRPHTRSEIEIGTDNDWTIAEMWQPPTINGPDTSILYDGAPLIDGSIYYARVRVASDPTWSNWLVAQFRMNSTSPAPVAISPNSGQIVLTGRPTLLVTNSTDAEGDALHYDFEVYRDSALTSLADYITGVIEGSGQTIWKTDSLTAENLRHWWRARASDGYENGPWSEASPFWVDAFNEPPSALFLTSPGSGAVIFDSTPAFVWSAAQDPDPAASQTYTLTLATDPDFVFKSEASGIPNPSYDWPSVLPAGASYYWKVRADDGRGGSATSEVRSFRVSSLGDENRDGVVDVFDVIMLIEYVFAGGTPPSPESFADVNGDCVPDVFDVIYLIHHVFEGGSAPIAGCARLSARSEH